MFDLELLEEYAKEVGFNVSRATNSCVAVDLGNGFHLCFENMEEEDDTIIYFEGNNIVEYGWHSHGDIYLLSIELSELFERNGDSIETLPLTILDCLLEGSILIEALTYASESKSFVSLRCGLAPYDTESLDPGESVLLYRPRLVASDMLGD